MNPPAGSSGAVGGPHIAAPEFDWIVIGSGLSGTLAAIRFRERFPRKRGLLVDAAARPCGDHTWSLHASDLPGERALHWGESPLWRWLAPHFRKTWPAQRVRFRDFERRLAIPYATLDSEGLRGWLEQARAQDPDGLRVLFGRPVVRPADGGIELSDGSFIRAPIVLDARGWLPPGGSDVRVGWQKFTGMELELSGPHELREPVIMDAACEQVDGYRFFYLLPYSETRILVEDTHYSDTSAIDGEKDAAEIEAYCRSRGWRISAVIRREQGALPIPVSGSIPSVDRLDAIKRDSPIPWGVRAGFFHPVTGYSASWAVQAAWRIGDLPELSHASVHGALVELRRELAATENFHLFLNRALFEMVEPVDRHRLLAAFHRVSESSISAFYAGRASRLDRFSILAHGAPEFSLPDAIRLLMGARRQERRNSSQPSTSGGKPS